MNANNRIVEEMADAYIDTVALMRERLAKMEDLENKALKDEVDTNELEEISIDFDEIREGLLGLYELLDGQPQSQQVSPYRVSRVLHPLIEQMEFAISRLQVYQSPRQQ